MMLVLTRRAGEKFFIGDDIEVVFLGMRMNQAMLGIKAPDDVRILREELLERIKKEKENE